MTLVGLTTERLRGGHWQRLSRDDLAALFAPDVVAFLPPGFHGLTTQISQRNFLTILSKQAEVVGLFEPSGAGVGLMILSNAEPDSSERNLGYLLARRVWGQGLATEMVAALQDRYRGTDVILCGGVMHDNTASARLLMRAGFVGEERGDETVYRWFGAQI